MSIMESAENMQVFELSREDQWREHDGFVWHRLPTMWDRSRALVCKRCGALVGQPGVHTAWHEQQAAG